jgi:2-iminobutanoate/2-iminopropanoate deaminase
MLKKICTDDAPRAIGPYSQGFEATGKLIFVSGQIPLCPKTLVIESTDIKDQTHQVLTNLEAILKAAGADFHHVAKATVYLKNMDDFAAVNEVYCQYFVEHWPARVCVEVARLPKDALVEIDAIAVL